MWLEGVALDSSRSVTNSVTSGSSPVVLQAAALTPIGQHEHEQLLQQSYISHHQPDGSQLSQDTPGGGGAGGGGGSAVAYYSPARGTIVTEPVDVAPDDFPAYLLAHREEDERDHNQQQHTPGSGRVLLGNEDADGIEEVVSDEDDLHIHGGQVNDAASSSAAGLGMVGTLKGSGVIVLGSPAPPARRAGDASAAVAAPLKAPTTALELAEMMTNADRRQAGTAGASGTAPSSTSNLASNAPPEFRVVLPLQRGLREATAKRLVVHDESLARHELSSEEASERLVLANSYLLIPVVTSLREYVRPSLVTNEVPMSAQEIEGLLLSSNTGEAARDGSLAVAGTGGGASKESAAEKRKREEGKKWALRAWQQENLRAFDRLVASQVEQSRDHYSNTSLHWVPHEQFRPLYADWRHYYAKHRSKRPDAVPSALLAAFFCGILINEETDPAEAVQLTRCVMEETLEVTDDSVPPPTTGSSSSAPVGFAGGTVAVDSGAVEACTYNAFLFVSQSIAAFLFPSHHPMAAVSMFAGALQERVHRIH